jgi:hypothetical protein
MVHRDRFRSNPDLSICLADQPILAGTRERPVRWNSRPGSPTVCCFEQDILPIIPITPIGRTVALEPIPIAFCITELDRGGAERAFTRLILGLDRQKWLPKVFAWGHAAISQIFWKRET